MPVKFLYFGLLPNPDQRAPPAEERITNAGALPVFGLCAVRVQPAYVP